MIRTNDCVDAASSELRSVGIEPRIEAAGKHIHLLWDHEGSERRFTVAASPSDWRAPMNSRSDIRKMLRNDGLLSMDDGTSAVAPIVYLKNGVVFCTSRDVASHFGKQHKDVLRSIDKSLEDMGDFGRRNFTPSTYLNDQGKTQRQFDLTRDGFTLIAMGFTGSGAMEWKIKYLQAFNAMEDEVRRISVVPELPSDVLKRIERIEGDLGALIDLSLVAPQPEPGFIIIKAHKRRVRGGREQ